MSWIKKSLSCFKINKNSSSSECNKKNDSKSCYNSNVDAKLEVSDKNIQCNFDEEHVGNLVCDNGQ
jgi:hypothetical protein